MPRPLPAIKMDAFTTPTKVKKEEDSDIASKFNVDEDLGVSPPIKRCCESPSPDLFTLPSPPPTTPLSTLQQQHFRCKQSTTSSSPPAFSFARPAKRVRFSETRIESNDDDDNETDELPQICLNTAASDNANTAPSQPPSQPQQQQPSSKLDLNNTLLRLHNPEGQASSIVALAEFIAGDHPSVAASLSLITRFSWPKFLEWYHDHSRPHHSSQQQPRSARFDTRVECLSADNSRSGNTMMVQDKYSWHAALLVAQEQGRDAGATAPYGGVPYFDLYEL